MTDLPTTLPSSKRPPMLIRIILEDLQQARAYANEMLSHVDESVWFRQPADSVNHIAWQVGHMTIAQYGLCLKRVRGVREEDSQLFDVLEFGELFGKGSIPSCSEHDYPTPVEIRNAFNAVHAQVESEIAAIDPSVLEDSAGPEHPMFNTKGGSLRFSAKHEMLHVGQIGLLRRFFGCTFIR
ncbi:MAG: DinB family protein [Fuerstiella sp.]